MTATQTWRFFWVLSKGAEHLEYYNILLFFWFCLSRFRLIRWTCIDPFGEAVPTYQTLSELLHLFSSVVCFASQYLYIRLLTTLNCFAFHLSELNSTTDARQVGFRGSGFRWCNKTLESVEDLVFGLSLVLCFHFSLGNSHNLQGCLSLKTF